MEDSPDFFKIRIPDPVRFLGLKVQIFPDPKLKAFKVQFLGIFLTFCFIFSDLAMLSKERAFDS